MGEGKELFSNLLYLSCLKLKRIHMPKWHTFGSHILLPFIRKSHQLASLANSFLFFSCSRRSLTSKTFTTKLKPDFFFSTGFLLRITFKYFVGYFFLALLKCLVLRDHFKIVFCFVRMSCLLPFDFFILALLIDSTCSHWYIWWIHADSRHVIVLVPLGGITPAFCALEHVKAQWKVLREY